MTNFLSLPMELRDAIYEYYWWKHILSEPGPEEIRDAVRGFTVDPPLLHVNGQISREAAQAGIKAVNARTLQVEDRRKPTEDKMRDAKALKESTRASRLLRHAAISRLEIDLDNIDYDLKWLGNVAETVQEHVDAPWKLLEQRWKTSTCCDVERAAKNMGRTLVRWDFRLHGQKPRI